jgi:hypothetical protein
LLEPISKQSEKEAIMELKDYCRSVEVELYGWKAKMYEMIRSTIKDTSPTSFRQSEAILPDSGENDGKEISQKG